MKRTPLNSPHARLRVAGRNLAAQSQSWRDLDLRAKALISLVVAVGTGVLLYAAVYPTSKNIAQFICYLLIAILAARLKVHLPGITGTMSVNFLFILLGVLELSLPETLILGSAAVVVQCFYRDRPSPIQVTFNLCASAFATAVAYDVYHLAIGEGWFRSHPLLLGLAASTYFLANTGSIATVISLTERKALNKIWVDCYFWSFPYYLVGAAFAGMLGWFNRAFGWETSLLIVPVIYLIYRSYRLYLGKLEDEKRHVEEMANLHLRTIEALALAIEAKDHTTHEHLQRVRVYAIEVAKELKISPPEMEALHAAALLHDIGKLAIPEHIINKPGRLTPEEFEKMKIHTLVGAEILQRVAFPYPVAPIVRSHHERWDGTGYPDGLKGEQIPMGARVLAAVDCLDALASHRQYQNAMSLDAAMEKVASMSGSAFEPRIVEVLKRRYPDLEMMAQSNSIPAEEATLSTSKSTDVRAEAGKEPAAGFEQSAPIPGAANEADFLSSIASARQEAQTMFELSQDLGNSLSLGETLSVLSMRLRKMIPYDSMAVFLLKDGRLLPELVSGDNFRQLSSLNIGLGEGLCGWVAEKRKPIVNGNPEAEAGYVSDPAKFTMLRSILAVPLE